mgnify:CR=1 FL=1
MLLSQGDEWKLGIDNDGKAYFTVNGTTATSDVTVAGGSVTVAGVRENNGMLKIYVDGELAGSAYLGENNADHAVSTGAITAGAARSSLRLPSMIMLLVTTRFPLLHWRS